MNAPIRAAALAAPAFAQPLVVDGELLHVGYQHGDLFLDLYGVRDADGYEVLTATLTGSPVSLDQFLSGRALAEMSAWCDDHLPSAHQLLLVSQQDAAAERALWQRLAGGLAAVQL